MPIDRSDSIIKTVFSRDIILLMILGLAGLLFSFYRKAEAFPTASLDITVGRSAAGQMAKRYAKLSGFKIPLDTSSTKYFSFDSEAETFLEYEFPLSEANRLMKNAVPIWFWSVHLVENDHNEFDAKIGVDGKVYSFEREVAKDKFITSETHNAAVAQVIDFTAKELNVDLPSWKLIHDDESNLPSRTDHSFVWENQQIDFKGGHLRIEATVSGDKLTKFDYALHVPDSFTQKFKWLRAQNIALASVSFIISFLAALSLPVLFLRSWVNGQLRVKFAIGCGIFGALVSFLTDLNHAATVVASTTNWSMNSFVAKHFLSDFTTALLCGLASTVFFGAIEVLYRTKFPHQVALEILVGSTTKALNTISIAKSAVLGTAIFGCLAGYQVLFFIIAKNYGLWVPFDLNERTVLNSFSPAWDGVSVGIQASTLEEFGFRIFFLVVFQRLTGSFWLANLLQSLTWGFGHCNYAVEPPYARGVELTVAGFFFGWIMRRYGVLSLVLGHYAFDVYLSVIPLFTSHNFADVFFAALSMAPLVVLPVSCIYLMHKRGIAPDETISNASVIWDPAGAETTIPAAEQQPWGFYKPLTMRRIIILLEISLFAMLGLLIPVRKLGEDALLLVDRFRATAIARSYFEREKFDVHDMQATAWLDDDTHVDQLQYIYARTDFNTADSLERLIEPRLIWNVRFCKTGNPNTFALKLGPDGNPISADITIDELTPGAKLTRLEAFEVAERYLKPIGAVSGGVFKIFDVSKTEYPNRTDYSFVAENRAGNLKKARFQTSFKIIGDQISNGSRFWSLPKSIDDEDRGTTSFWVNLAKLAAAILVVSNVGYWYFYIFKRQTPNKFLVAVATLTAGVIAIIEQVNRESCVAFFNYIPTEPVDTHILHVVFDSLMQIALNMTLAAFVAAVVTASYPHIFASANPVELYKNAKSMIGKKRVWTDAVLIGYAAAIVIAAIWHFRDHLLGLYSTRALLTNVKNAAWLEQYSPAATSLLYAITRGMLAFCVAAAGLRWSEFYQNGSWSENAHKGVDKASPLFTPIFIAIVICIGNLDIHNPVGMLIQIITALISALALYLLLVRIGNRNLAACFFTTFFLLVGADAAYLQAHDSVIHRFDVVVLVLLLVLPISWLSAQAVVATFSKGIKAES